MRCLVVGGAGFIGKKLVDELVANGSSGIAIDIGDDAYINKSFDFIQTSFLDLPLPKQCLQDVDIVYHLACTSVPASAGRNIPLDIQQNVLGSVKLAIECLEAGVKRFVFVSSGGTVYGDGGVHEFYETNRTLPTSAYGAAKLSIENYLRVLGVSEGLDYRILRLANPYGPGQSAYGIQGVIPVLMRRIYLNEVVEIWGDGEAIRDYVFIDDVVAGIVKVGMSDLSQQTYNLGSGSGRSVNYLIKKIENVIGKKAIINLLPSREFDVRKNVLNCSKILENVGWQATTNLDDGLAATWEKLAKSLV